MKQKAANLAANSCFLKKKKKIKNYLVFQLQNTQSSQKFCNHLTDRFSSGNLSTKATWVSLYLLI